MSIRDEISLITDEIRGREIEVICPEGPGQSSFGLEIVLVINLIDVCLRARYG